MLKIFPQEFAFLRQSNGSTEVSPRQAENGIGEQLDFVLLTHDSVNPFSPEVRTRVIILLTKNTYRRTVSNQLPFQAAASKPKASKITRKSNGSSSVDTLDGNVDQGAWALVTTFPLIISHALFSVMNRDIIHRNHWMSQSNEDREKKSRTNTIAGSPTKTPSPKLCNAALMVLRLLGEEIFSLRLLKKT